MVVVVVAAGWDGVGWGGGGPFRPVVALNFN